MINKNLILIISIGLLSRLIFYFFGAEIYFGKEDFNIGGDTYWWVNSIVNLIENGCYCNDINDRLSCFVRTPGYSFFIGIFYLFSKDIDFILKLIPFVQIILDCFSIYFIYEISIKSFDDKNIGYIASLIYSFFPFVIVWNVIVYAESLSFFLLLFSLYIVLNYKSYFHYILSGIILGFAILTRIQIIVGIPIFLFCVFYLLRNERHEHMNYFLKFSVFALALIFTYSLWPIRNYLNHDKIILSQHLGDKHHWAPDYMKYMDYIWSVKVDHEPQLTQIISNSKVTFPKSSYIIPEDSTLINEFVHLARNCGEGFSYFANSAGYRSDVIKKENCCNERLVDIFDTLISHQKKYNPLNYYITVPLKNFYKAIFKSDLKKASSNMVYTLGKLLFLTRTILIFLGLFGIFLIIKKNKSKVNFITLLSLLYFLSWYFFQCFIYRNMEIRYLIHSDILLIIPASYTIIIFGNYLRYRLRIK